MGFGPGEAAPPIPYHPGITHTYANPDNGAPVWGDQYKDVQTGPNGGSMYVPGTDAASQDVSRYRSMGEAASNRSAVYNDYGQANASLAQGGAALQQGQGAISDASGYLGQGNQYLGAGMEDRGAAGMARNQQYGALGLQADAAMGNAPSQAQMLGRSMIDQSLQAQLAGAASARGGPMAQAAAMRQAAGGAAGFQASGMQQIDAMRAAEMAQARDSFQAGATGIRAQDYTGAGQATDMARATTGMATAGTGLANAATGVANAYNGMAGTSAGMTNAQGQLEMQQRQLNQQSQQFNEGKAFDVRQAELNAAMGGSSQDQQARQFKQQMDQQASDRQTQLAASVIGGGATLGAAALKAKGGPIAAGKPYIVGERGPELIVPSHHGTVIPAGPTRHLVSMAEAARMRQQADQMQAGYGQQLAQGPAVGSAPRAMTLPTQVIDDAPERPSMGQVAALYGGRDYPAGPAPMPAAPPERLMGGREDPYGPPIDRADPWAPQPREEGGPVAPGQSYVVGEKGPEVVVPAPAPRQMQTFQRETPVYVDPRLPNIRYSEEGEKHRRLAASAELATAVYNPAFAVTRAGQDLATDVGALSGRAIEDAKANAGSVPSRAPNAPQASGTRLVVQPPETAESRGQAPLYPTDENGEPIYAPPLATSLPPPKPPPIEVVQVKPRGKSMGAVAATHGRRR